MRSLILIFISFVSSFGFAQSEFHHWYSAGASGDIVKRLDWSFDMNSRFDQYGLRTLFPQAGIEYKLNKLLKTSVDYRMIFSRNEVRNYTSSNRVNLNLTAKEKLAKRLYGSLRARYQFGFSGTNSTYDADFDQTFRIKPKVEYDIKGFPLTPAIGTEFFLGRSNTGPALSKIRSEFGFELEGTGNHSFELKYLYEYRPLENFIKHRNILSLSYSYSI